METHTKWGLFGEERVLYREVMDERKNHPTSSSHDGRQVWKWLWVAKIQPKAKMFGWRVLHNGVPVRVNLAQRGMHIDQVCPRCGEEDETLEHLLLHCEVSKRVWYQSPLRLDVTRARGGKFREWVGGNKKEDEWWSLFWMLFWQIWLSRNMWVFEGQKRDEKEMVERAVKGAMELVESADECVTHG